MFFWIRKKEMMDLNEKFDRIHSSLHRSFLNVKTDMTHLNSKFDKLQNYHRSKENEFLRLQERVDQLELLFNEAFGAKQKDERVFGQPFGQTQTDSRLKQPSVVVQTDKIGDKHTKNMTPMERAIISIMINSDIKLSYEDLSVMIGRDKSTIRGQINNIKQKNESLLTEFIERNGKKRFFVEERVKNEILKERNALSKRAFK